MSSPDVSRRLFLRGKVDIAQRTPVIRPPWTIDNAQFLEQCTRCDDCLSACPEKIIIQGDGGYPEINFKKGECTFCGKCAEACDADLFNTPTTPYIEPSFAWQLSVVIEPKCLSLNAVVCRACGDNCEPQAISFQLKVGGISEPQINLDDCTACGACLHVCPVDAVEITPNTSKLESNAA